MENLSTTAPSYGVNYSGSQDGWSTTDETASAYVVRDCVGAPPGGAGLGEVSPSRLIRSLKAGLPVENVDELGRGLALPMDALVKYLGIPRATWHRRKLAGRLDPAESDRVIRFARLLGKAVEVLESPQNARAWLASPQIGLGGAVPLEYAGTEVGAREVENLLTRIDFGVYA